MPNGVVTAQDVGLSLLQSAANEFAQMKQAALQRYSDELQDIPYIGEAIVAVASPTLRSMST